MSMQPTGMLKWLWSPMEWITGVSVGSISQFNEPLGVFSSAESFEEMQAKCNSNNSLLVALFLPSQLHPLRTQLVHSLMDEGIFESNSSAVFWAADATDNYSLAMKLRVEQFPAVVVLKKLDPVSINNNSSSSHRWAVLLRLEGFSHISMLQPLLETIQQRSDSYDQKLIARQQQVTADQRLREEQDAAYQRSLAIDAEKAARRRREQQLKMAEEAEAALELQKANELKINKRTSINQLVKQYEADLLEIEEESSQSKDQQSKSIRLSLQLPNNSRSVRSFDSTKDTTDSVYKWAYVQLALILESDESLIDRMPTDIGGISLVEPMVGSAQNTALINSSTTTLSEAGVQSSIKLLLQISAL